MFKSVLFILLVCCFSQSHGQVDQIEPLFLRSDSLLLAGDYQSAIKPAAKALRITKTVYGTQHEYTGILMHHMAIIYTRAAMIDSAEKYHLAYYEFAKRITLENKEWIYKESLESLVNFYIEFDFYREAIPFAEEEYEFLVKKQSSANNVAPNQEIYKLVIDIIDYYSRADQFKRATKWLVVWNDLNLGIVEASFDRNDENYNRETISAFQDNADWLQYLNFLDDFENDTITEMCLNNQLVLKALVLNQSLDMYAALRLLQDASVDQKIEALFANQKWQWQMLKEAEEPHRTVLWDSITLENQQIQQFLQEKYDEKIASNTGLMVDWRTIQEKLQPGEMAIDFATITNYGDEPVYLAYIISPNKPKPHVMHLFAESQLDDLLVTQPTAQYAARGGKNANESIDLSKGERLYHLIWEPLEPSLLGVKTIYFSTAGKLSYLAMAALPNRDAITLSARYNLFQFINLSVIAFLQEDAIQFPAVFSGAIEYNFHCDDEVYVKYGIDPKEKGIFNSWQYLPGTKREIEQIVHAYRNEDKTALIIDGETATEMWFQSLSGNSPRVIHLATHGFYYSEESVFNAAYQSIIHGDFGFPNLGDESMERTGLILAHANFAWEHSANPMEPEDGILTADEIAQLNLATTDLVVLSACESGLGDIQGNEGVFGLQRAFKMAGVRYLIISLWQVPDLETSEFMQAFYGYWLSGVPLRDAFNKTQRVMGAKYAANPEKWAAFVLVE